MRLDELFEKLPKQHNPHQIDPALLTFREYVEIVNPKGIHHSSDSYDSTLENFEFMKIEEFPEIIQRVKINGLYFEFRLQTTTQRYAKFTPDYKMIGYYTDDEIKQQGWRTEQHTIGAFHEGKCVGSAQDEWGSLLIHVAREYRGFNLGPYLGKIARTIEPGRDSGGFTNAGLNNLAKIHRQFVHDAMTSGLYRRMLKANMITIDRIKEIVNSSDKAKLKKNTRDLSDNSSDLLLYFNGSGFVLYNKKLRYIEDDFWEEKFIKGYCLLRDWHDIGRIVHLGGENDGFKSFLLSLAISVSNTDWGYPVKIDKEDMHLIDSSQVEMKNDLAYWKIKPINVEALSLPEKAFRKDDKFHEFEARLLELAETKYRK